MTTIISVYGFRGIKVPRGWNFVFLAAEQRELPWNISIMVCGEGRVDFTPSPGDFRVRFRRHK
jgi:hypothetical protein